MPTTPDPEAVSEREAVEVSVQRTAKVYGANGVGLELIAIDDSVTVKVLPATGKRRPVKLQDLKRAVDHLTDLASDR